MHAFDRQTDGRTERPSQYRALHYMQSHGKTALPVLITQSVSAAALERPLPEWPRLRLDYCKKQRGAAQLLSTRQSVTIMVAVVS